MRMTRVLCLLMSLSFFLFSQWCEISYGNESLPTVRESLIDKYRKIEKELKKSTFAVPFHLESSVTKNASLVDIYGTVDYPFVFVKKELLVPTNWCEIVLPHPDIRACTYKKLNDRWLLNIYHVDKFFKPLETAYQMKFVYRVNELQPSYFDIAFTADNGPFHTTDHHFELEAIPLGEVTTFVHFRYSYQYSSWGYFLMKIFGDDRVGFSVIGTDINGNPVYVNGLRGAVECHVARYYLAILSYLDTTNIPPDKRFESRISNWYNLAALYKKQQFVVTGKKEYLAYKRQDLKSQSVLQNDLNNAAE